MSGIVRLPFRDVTTIPRTTGAGYEISEIDLAIASFASTSPVRVMAALYENFRVRNLRVQAVYDSQGVVTATTAIVSFMGFAHALAFMPESNGLYGTATSFQDVLQLPSAKIGPGSRSLALRISKRELGHNPLKWYNTNMTTGTPAPGSGSPGSITYATRSLTGQTTNYSNSYIVMSGVVEFCNPLASGLSELQRNVWTEEEKDRSNAHDEHFVCTPLRVSDFTDSSISGSVPNTPRSSSSVAGTLALSEGQRDLRSSRNFSRPRLTRQ
jgi:hypothetical protein